MPQCRMHGAQSGNRLCVVARHRDTNDRCMMFIETCIATVILLGVAISGLAQEKPDFSGEWILNRQASTLSPGADAVQSGVWRIEHREPTFRHKAAFVTQSNPFEYEYELLSDGREVVGTRQGARTVSSLRWEAIAYLPSVLDGSRRLVPVEGVDGRDAHDSLVEALFRLGAVEARALLNVAAADRSSLVRSEAVEALEQQGDTSSLPVLTKR